MNFIFQAKTTEGYCFKVLADLLQHSIKTAYYEIDHSGIYLRMSDSKQHITFDIALPCENFFLFELATDRLCFGIPQMHMSTMLKIVKKKDTITLFISADSPHELGICIEPRERTNVTTSYIKICQSHNVAPYVPPKTAACVIPISSGDYAKVCKEMSKLCKTVLVASGPGRIKFATETNNIYSKEVVYGESSAPLSAPEGYLSKYLSNLSKIAGLGTVIHLQHVRGMLHIHSAIGMLGRFSVYIKSLDNVQDEMSSDDEVIEI